MVHSCDPIKRRAGAGAFTALICFAISLTGTMIADRIRDAALRPGLNLWPILGKLHQVEGYAVTYGYWQALTETVSRRHDILAAAVVSSDGRILSTYPADGTLAGKSLMPSFAELRFPVPGSPTDRPALSLDDPQVESRFRELIYGIAGTTWPSLQSHLIAMKLPGHPDDAGPALLILPRPYQGRYVLATYYLRPAFIVGALVSLVVFWLMLPWWTYLDARPRTEKAVPLAALVLLTNFLGWLTYLVIRPEVERLCPACLELMELSYRCCPQCGWSSQARCRQCGRPARSDWRFCPYCEAPSGENELTTARAAARREIEGAGG